MSAYWLGVLTLPAAALVGYTILWWSMGAVSWLAEHGITFEAKWSRDVEGVSDYTLRHDIWWERSLGPVFAGGWYSEQERYQQAPIPRFNRWVSIGRTTGPCIAAYLSRTFAPPSGTTQPDAGGTDRG